MNPDTIHSIRFLRLIAYRQPTDRRQASAVQFFVGSADSAACRASRDRAGGFKDRRRTEDRSGRVGRRAVCRLSREPALRVDKSKPRERAIQTLVHPLSSLRSWRLGTDSTKCSSVLSVLSLPLSLRLSKTKCLLNIASCCSSTIRGLAQSVEYMLTRLYSG